MKLLNLLTLIILTLMASCVNKEVDKMNFIRESVVKQTIKAITAEVPESEHERVTRGVKQVASFWMKSDGTESDFISFCKDNFIRDSSELELVFNKLMMYYESIFGTLNKLYIDLNWNTQVAEGDILPIDLMFSAYDPSSNLNNDMFSSKIAFYTMLNFPYYSLKEKKELGKRWTRQQWAYVRMGDVFVSRTPAEIEQQIASVSSAADNYIANYNIYVGNLIDDNKKTYFDKDKKLITHWNLRDEIKSQYAYSDGLFKQKMIYEVMNRIITQTIPEQVINSDKFTWNPFSNEVFKDGKKIESSPEPNIRYKHLRDNFKARLAADSYNPNYPTYIERQFNKELEMSVDEVEKLFAELVSSATVKKVAKLIKQRLQRDLQPFDIWYDGFKARSLISDARLTEMTKGKYPNSEAFAKDMTNILVKLGFDLPTAQRLSSLIEVDPSRGAGHAMGARMKTEKARLRTRVGSDGMDYKGYNIAIHEFGHNVEQTITLQDIDYYMLSGVPNTAFTEAMAFLFQKRDLELLGINNDDPSKDYLLALDNFWASYEIMGVSLVDINTWKWLYKNPNATPEQLKEAVIDIANRIWNKFYADVFGVKDQPILAIYSHMISYPLYLSAYPIGHLIELQIDESLQGKNFASEITRMLLSGRIIPELWMQEAVGDVISVQATINAAEKALSVIKN